MNTYEVNVKFVVDAEDAEDARVEAAGYLEGHGAGYIAEGAEITELEGEVTDEQVATEYRNGMFSPEGNVAVELLIRNVRAALAPKIIDGKQYFLAESEAYELISIGQMRIAAEHSEVHDTEPEVAICEGLDEVWNDLYGHDCQRGF